MKKFAFTLSRLKSFKEQILKREKNELGRLRVEQQTLIDEKQATLDRIKLTNDELKTAFSKGLSSPEISVRKNYIGILHNQVMELEVKIARFDEKIEKQTAVVVQANIDVSTLEKLEEKQLFEYNEKLRKSEELAIEEFVSNAAIKESVS